MGLRIPVDHTKLVDSPYNESNNTFFDFTTSDTEGFAQDIVNGNPTCYLISGYRGAGKSSFIKKLNADVNSKDPKALFVYLNFAKHEERTILLRKLIRNFYLQFESSDLFQKTNLNSSLKDTLERFKELYERTFYAVSKNTNEKKSDSSSSVFKFIIPIKRLAIYLGVYATLFLGLGIREWYTWAIITIISYFSYERSSTKEKTASSQISKDMLYDDEIAEYYLIEVIKSFKEQINVVFVLDELDKINDNELVEGLINELKPIMLSGLANFIVVAGQNLYYNYYISQTTDDGALSSLFSRVHHISLHTVSELRILFNEIIDISSKGLSESDKDLLHLFTSYLIFESKRVPRRFIILIRQKIIWENNTAILNIEKDAEELTIYSKILDNIESIDDNEIATKDYPASIRDYFIMQLFLKATKILLSQNRSFTFNEITNENG